MLKKKRKLIFVLLLLCIVISMSFVSANDNITMNISQNQDNKIVDYSQNRSFKDLDNEINSDLNKTEIILKDNYVNGDEVSNLEPRHTNAIYINHSVTIDGQGHVIDANYSSRIFHINANNVLLKNIIFKNSISNDTGAIYCNGTNITIMDCTFKDNILYNKEYISSKCSGLWRYDTSTGVAINFKYDGIIINSTFANNKLFKIDSNNMDAAASNIHNESISLSNNSEDVYDIVSFDKNHNVTIINSTFKNELPILVILLYPPVLALEDNESENELIHPSDIIWPGGIRVEDNLNTNLTSINDPSKVVENKVSSMLIAKNKLFKKKLKTKLYSVVLKSKKGNVLKSTWITLKIKGKLFKAKTNSKGKATFKITKFYKKGNFKAVVKFNGSKKYKSVSKKVNIKIK